MTEYLNTLDLYWPVEDLGPEPTDPKFGYAPDQLMLRWRADLGWWWDFIDTHDGTAVYASRDATPDEVIATLAYHLEQSERQRFRDDKFTDLGKLAADLLRKHNIGS